MSDSVVAAPDRRDAVGDALRERVEVERLVVGTEDAEVLHPRLVLVAEQPARALLDDPQPEVLEDRHRPRELELGAGPEEPDPREHHAVGAALVAHADDESLLSVEQALEAGDVQRAAVGPDRGLVGLGHAA